MICTLSNKPYLKNIWEKEKKKKTQKTSERKESKHLNRARVEGEKAEEFLAKNTGDLIHDKTRSFLIAQAKSVRCQAL